MPTEHETNGLRSSGGASDGSQKRFPVKLDDIQSFFTPRTIRTILTVLAALIAVTGLAVLVVLPVGVCNYASSEKQSVVSHDSNVGNQSSYDANASTLSGSSLEESALSDSSNEKKSGVSQDSNAPSVSKAALFATEAGTKRTISISGVDCTFCYCPAGTFVMGSPETEEERWRDETQHKVTFTYGFWMLETECTQRLWTAVMGNNPSEFKGDDLPVERVNYVDVLEFSMVLNRLNILPDGYVFRAPTEAEWEYACRAGTTTPYNWGSVLNGDEANCPRSYPRDTKREGPVLGKTCPVKSYLPNEWGLYDMHGNVSEWCIDGYYQYPNCSVRDFFIQFSNLGVSRGGGWRALPGFCRSAARCSQYASERRSYLGFRFVVCRESEEIEAAFNKIGWSLSAGVPVPN